MRDNPKLRRTLYEGVEILQKATVDPREPWLSAAAILAAEAVPPQFEKAKKELQQYHFEDILQTLREIIEEDKHILYCCGDLRHFTRLLDFLFMASQSPSAVLGAFEARYAYFAVDLYEAGPFSKAAYVHVFNLWLEDSQQRPFGEAVLETVPPTAIPYILGESSTYSFLHQPSAGNTYLVFRDERPCPENMLDWLFDKQNVAYDAVRVLQYIKDDSVALDYVAPVFGPWWVNYIRKGGMYFLGKPRVRPARTKYVLSEADYSKACRLLSALQKPEIAARLRDHSNNLRQVLNRAGRRFEHYPIDEDLEDQFIDLAIALETICSPSDKLELRHRIAQCGATFLEPPGEQRHELYNRIRRMYDMRSKLLHEGEELPELEAPIAELASIVRKLLLGVGILYLKGVNKRDEVLKRVEGVLMGVEEWSQLQRDADLDSYLSEVIGEEA
jgi:hypothetical protein